MQEVPAWALGQPSHHLCLGGEWVRSGVELFMAGHTPCSRIMLSCLHRGGLVRKAEESPQPSPRIEKAGWDRPGSIPTLPADLKHSVVRMGASNLVMDRGWHSYNTTLLSFLLFSNWFWIFFKNCFDLFILLNKYPKIPVWFSKWRVEDTRKEGNYLNSTGNSTPANWEVGSAIPPSLSLCSYHSARIPHHRWLMYFPPGYVVYIILYWVMATKDFQE